MDFSMFEYLGGDQVESLLWSHQLWQRRERLFVMPEVAVESAERSVVVLVVHEIVRVLCVSVISTDRTSAAHAITVRCCVQRREGLCCDGKRQQSQQAVRPVGICSPQSNQDVRRVVASTKVLINT